MITDAELKALMQAIYNRYGLDFTNYETNSLKRGIVRLNMKHKFSSILELWSKILKDKDFFMQAIDDLTVNLTELFRNPDSWIMIKEKVLSQYNKQPKINIWHAGCSTGEEVYTMAMVLQDKGFLHKTSTLATDLSQTALKSAKKGEYSLMLLNQYLKPFLAYYPDRTMEDFFVFNNSHAIIKDQCKRHITFQYHNLVHDVMHSKFDMIFCRNVMIYFDEKLKERVLQMFYDSLSETGYLVIGYYDIMPDKGKELFEVFDLKTKIYKRKTIKL
jgi:chemotaxis protein methyltransferase CheR